MSELTFCPNWAVSIAFRLLKRLVVHADEFVFADATITSQLPFGC